MAQLDVLDLMHFNKPGYGALDGAYDVLKPTSPTEGFLVHVKNPGGFPIDLRRYGWDSISQSPYIFDALTEGDPPFGWKDPRYVKVHTGNLLRGNRICPRYPKTLPAVTREYESPFMILADNRWDFVPHQLDATEYTLNTPYSIPWGGSVGTALTYRLDYKWNGRANPKGIDKVATRDGLVQGTYDDWERYWYSMGWGLVRWEHWKLINGTYVMDMFSLSLHLQTLADWRKTYPTLKEFTYLLPFMRA